jgi:hypothetical protein
MKVEITEEGVWVENKAVEGEQERAAVGTVVDLGKDAREIPSWLVNKCREVDERPPKQMAVQTPPAPEPTNTTKAPPKPPEK